jgi:hypothetical protein
MVEVKNLLDATKYAVFVVFIAQHVSGTNMPIIRITISEYLATASEQCSLQEAQCGTTQALSRYGHLTAEDIN